ncbi:MAG: amidohydrolase [Dehalococcoidia bacterium]|nr:amidohydrolase [Dehalococcoidia bacterium]
MADLKDRVCQEIDRHADSLIALAEDIFEHPELGYKETRTAGLVAERFRALGMPFETELALTGVKGMLAGSAPGPTIAVLGELDSLIVADHPAADQATGAVHACGHNAQIATMIGTTTGLAKSGVLSQLAGRVACMAVPAEEYVEVGYRLGLKSEGKIEFLGGKPELLRVGAFDGVDMAMMVHTSSNRDDGRTGVSKSSNGCVVKQVTFLGHAAHAGGAPHRGINALNAATLALQAIHANRETFRDEDMIRVHPIITRGGDVVNAVPAEVWMETFVRGRTMEAITDANRKVDRALRAGALAVGARVRIETLPGYLPLLNDPQLISLYKDNAVSLVGADEVREIGTRGGSTDMGDITHIMPAIHPYAGGATGTGHGNDYHIKDYETAVLLPAKVMAMAVIDLLAEDAQGARALLGEHKPRMSRKEYLESQRGLDKTVEFDGAEA